MCASCEILYINGTKCHETGCPDAWKDYTSECSFCGCEFKPEESHQDCCDEECSQAYHG